jgi:hypothetical protein
MQIAPHLGQFALDWSLPPLGHGFSPEHGPDRLPYGGRHHPAVEHDEGERPTSREMYILQGALMPSLCASSILLLIPAGNHGMRKLDVLLVALNINANQARPAKGHL